MFLTQPIFLVVFISLAFWSIYHRWDNNRNKFVEFPITTFWYFLIASVALIFLYPPIVEYLRIEFLGLISCAVVLTMTYFLYRILDKLFVGPKESKLPFFEYYKILDVKFIVPKFTEIVFQQVFFVSVFAIALKNFSPTATIIIVVLAFVLAHLNLFLFRTKAEALFYLIFSAIGAPIFLMLIIATGSIWFSVSFHMLFYTVLSSFAWILTRVKY